MSRFAVIYEDPDYEDWADENDEFELVETDFSKWSPEAQARLIKDVVLTPQEEFSPFSTVNS
jgi:hypothetical protein